MANSRWTALTSYDGAYRSTQRGCWRYCGVVAGENDVTDRMALRDLVERYALAVDNRDLDTVVELFIDDGILLSHLMPGTEKTPLARQGHDELRRVLKLGLAQYMATTHVIGGHVIELAGDEATGDTTCIAHHVYQGDDVEIRLLVMAIHYEDRYRRQQGRWRFAERRLRLQWSEDRPLTARRLNRQ
jgi:ketosteroid isomerase-like protein